MMWHQAFPDKLALQVICTEPRILHPSCSAWCPRRDTRLNKDPTPRSKAITNLKGLSRLFTEMAVGYNNSPAPELFPHLGDFKKGMQKFRSGGTNTCGCLTPWKHSNAGLRRPTQSKRPLRCSLALKPLPTPIPTALYSTHKSPPCQAHSLSLEHLPLPL